ncbi:hypothetical protein Mal4_39170 [Maioricimonas rarisocia]|uniref:Uncharacterized protein n=1 Tax=Maioricimonas rarisocia TaxID=2528026 RepID=A0A517ZAR1_9PLAN|nr:hypothetical protein [Maioricimonas rarisocia]QDU39572.1 hypothetical protein Mal4_39170 [Maioricimonas rarisocia]
MSFRSAMSALTLCAILVVCQPADAQVVPFETSTEDAAYSPCTAQYTGTGKATHMGKVSFEGIAIPIPTDDPLLFDWIGLSHEVTAANGDTIVMSGGGTLELIPVDPLDPATEFTAIWSGTFEVVGGTGRFANVAGVPGEPLIVEAINDPFVFPPDCESDPLWTFSATIEGPIDLGRKKGKK